MQQSLAGFRFTCVAGVSSPGGHLALFQHILCGARVSVKYVFNVTFVVFVTLLIVVFVFDLASFCVDFC